MICRVCLNSTQFEINMFDDESNNQDIAQIIQKHFWFTPIPGDPISTTICFECLKKILDFHDFYETVEQAHILYEKNKVTEEVKLPDEIQIQNDDLQDLDDLLEICADLDITEPLDCDETFSSIFNSENESTRESQLEENSNDTSRCSKEISEYSTTSFTSAVETSTQDDSISESNKKPQRRKEKYCWVSAESQEILRKHIKINCDICNFLATKFADLQKHFEEEHRGIKAFIRCCGRKFNNYQRIVQHAYMHEDPNYFQCDICKKSFASSYSLHSHQIAYHPTDEELIFNCDQCDKSFSRQHLLNYHKALHIPEEERQFQCTQCPKKYGSDQMLKAHISMRHTSATICHICAKSIRDKQAFEKHVRLHFGETGPRIKCPRPDCDKWLKDEINLKVHLRRHKQVKNSDETFQCDQCDKVVTSKRSLINHKTYAHPKEIFTCSECGKVFKREITLKEHMTQHTGETLYKCPFCERTFNSNANMHAHKKKAHPVEWENWRKTKTSNPQYSINKT